MKVASQVLKTLNVSAADLKPSRMGFEVNGKTYIYKDGGQLANHRAEFLSLQKMNEAAPGFVPEPIGAGQDENGKPYFCCEYVNMGSCYGSAAQEALGRRLAEMHLHNSKSEDPVTQYGFEMPTWCGGTKMDNSWEDSWADFYANRRLRPIAAATSDPKLEAQVEQICEKVVPILCGSDKIRPAIQHGDLWSGNMATRSGTEGPVVFDACSFYGHNEADLGIMTMFGGASNQCFEAYHKVIPKLQPYYEERHDLYQLYHQLNHAALFGGGGYASSSSRIMTKLLAWEKNLKK